MTETSELFAVDRIPDLVTFDTARIRLAEKRQSALWEGRVPDKWPCIMGGRLKPEQEEIPHYNYKEAFEDKERMLCTEVRGALSMANSDSDGVPSLRVNFGTGILPACFGLEQQIYEDKMPWLLSHLTKEQASKLDPEKIEPAGSFAMGLEYMKFYREILGDTLPIFCMDTQGPFDLAHLLIGDDLFMQMYDDPAYVHHVMEVCLSLNIKAHTWMKQIADEARSVIHHSNCIYGENMGIRICEDTTALLGPDAIAEFAMPYTRRAAQHFGGAWVHYCGWNEHLTKAILAIPEIRGINFGHIPGHEQEVPFEASMEWTHAAGKVYFGSWPRFKGETSRAYLDRMYSWASKGALLPMLGNAVDKDGEFATTEAVLEYWYK